MHVESLTCLSRQIPVYQFEDSMASKYPSLSTRSSREFLDTPSDYDDVDESIYEVIDFGGSDDSESITSAGSMLSRAHARMRHVGIFWDMNSCRLPESASPKVNNRKHQSLLIQSFPLKALILFDMYLRCIKLIFLDYLCRDWSSVVTVVSRIQLCFSSHAKEVTVFFLS